MIALVVLSLSGCVVADEDLEGTRDLDPSVPVVELRLLPDGSAVIDFTFHYELQIVDAEGIEPVWWRYALIRACSDADRDADACELTTRPLLAEHEQEMRKGEPGKTEIFVEGDRPRKLEMPAGMVFRDDLYILWIDVRYRDESVGHHLEAVSVGSRGVPSEADVGVTEELPEIEPIPPPP